MNITDEMASFVTVSWIATSVCSEDGKYVQRYFRRENNKGLTVHHVLEWSALFLCLITTLHGDVASGMKWRRLRGFSPSPTAYIVRVYYIRRAFDFLAHRKEVGGLWHMNKQDMRPLHLFCWISFLQKSFVEELAEKWLFCTKSVHSHMTATYGPSATLKPTTTWWTRGFTPNPPLLTNFLWLRSWIHHLGRGRMAWVAILYPPPTSGN